MKYCVLQKMAAFVFLVLFCCAAGKGWHSFKDGFSIRRINLDFSQIYHDRLNLGRFDGPVNPPNLTARGIEEAPFFDPALAQVFSQKYVYLSRGRQCYAFASEDGRYVLKFPRSDSYKIPFWLKACSFSFLDDKRKVCLEAKKNRLNWLVNSFSLAYSDLKQETALLYLHLSPTQCLNCLVPIQDSLGRVYYLDLDKTVFALQEKKPLLIPFFQERLKNGDREGAKAVLEAFMDLVATRAKRGIFNKDGSFLRNFGFDDGRAIQVDIGDFYRRGGQDDCFSFSFQQTTGHVEKWLGEVDPEMQSWFRMRVSQRVQ